MVTRSRLAWAVAVVLAGLIGCEAEPGADAAGEAAPRWEAAAEAIRPSVHSVWASRRIAGGSARAFGPVGTAFAIRRDGLLLTGAHVVTGEDGEPLPRLHVLIQRESGNVVREAEVLSADRGRDLALLRVPDTTLVPVRWAGARAPMGAPVATIGYGLPEGGVVDTTDASITTRFTVFPRFAAGYSSGYRTLEPGDPSTNVLELDLPLFGGVSGGPVFGPDARVLGVTWRQVLSPAGATPFGSAIPVLVVRQFLDAVRDSIGVDAMPDSLAGRSAP